MKIIGKRKKSQGIEKRKLLKRKRAKEELPPPDEFGIIRIEIEPEIIKAKSLSHRKKVKGGK
jgi:hypothetical protein